MFRIGGAMTPRFRELDRRECEAILAEHSVGRLAFALHDRVDVLPLHYALVDGWI
jgi:nitroimidazol reductase NimA-like FMN-containing flavoprotein (pyridoxamine 5'-phosphate oxidase superfamily)